MNLHHVIVAAAGRVPPSTTSAFIQSNAAVPYAQYVQYYAGNVLDNTSVGYVVAYRSYGTPYGSFGYYVWDGLVSTFYDIQSGEVRNTPCFSFDKNLIIGLRTSGTYSGYVYISTDKGVTFITRNTGYPSSGYLAKIDKINNLYTFFGFYSGLGTQTPLAAPIYSADLQTWSVGTTTKQYGDNSRVLGRIGTYLYGFGFTYNTINGYPEVDLIRSSDGVNWDFVVNINAIAPTYISTQTIAYINGKLFLYVYSGNTTYGLYSSDDGATWTTPTPLVAHDPISGVITPMLLSSTHKNGIITNTGNVLVSRGTYAQTQGAQYGYLLFSSDGINWYPLQHMEVVDAQIIYGTDGPVFWDGTNITSIPFEAGYINQYIGSTVTVKGSPP